MLTVFSHKVGCNSGTAPWDGVPGQPDQRLGVVCGLGRAAERNVGLF